MKTFSFTVFHGERRTVLTSVKDFKVDNGVIVFYDKDSEIIIGFKEWSFFEREV